MATAVATISRSDVDVRQQWQEYADEQLHEVGVRAQAPVSDQDGPQYLRALARNLKYGYLAPNHPLYQTKWDKSLPNDALCTLFPQLLDAVKAARNDASTVPPGEFREIITTDPRTGYKEHRFIGPESFVRGMTTPGRRVTAFGVIRENVAVYRGNERSREVGGGANDFTRLAVVPSNKTWFETGQQQGGAR